MFRNRQISIEDQKLALKKYYISELKAMRKGMLTARELGRRRVILESDSYTAIRALHGCKEVLSIKHVIIEDCRTLLNCKDWEVMAV